MHTQLHIYLPKMCHKIEIHIISTPETQVSVLVNSLLPITVIFTLPWPKVVSDITFVALHMRDIAMHYVTVCIHVVKK